MDYGLVSIIVPVYNIQRYLEKSILSVLAQTYINWELLLIDDGSTDSSGSICRRYAEENPKIKYFYQDNSGVAVAREIGVKLSTGKYITFLDGDDYIDSVFCERLVTLIEQYEVEWVACDFEEDGNKIYDGMQHNDKDEKLGKDKIIECYFKQKLFTSFIWGKLFRRELFEGYSFPKLRVGEDTCCMFDLFMKTEEAYITKERLYSYVIRNDSAIHSNSFNLASFDLLLMMDYIEKHCKSHYPEYQVCINKRRVNILRGLYWGVISLNDYTQKETLRKELIHRIRKTKIKGVDLKLTMHMIAIKTIPVMYDFILAKSGRIN